MDHLGPMARSAADCAAILEVIAGQDVKDPTSSVIPVPHLRRDIELRRVPRLGVDPVLVATFDSPTREMLDRVVEATRSMGWAIVEIETPDLPGIADEWVRMCSVETAYEHRDTYAGREGDYGPDLSNLITLGQSISGVEYQGLLERRRAFTGRMRRMFDSVDLLLLPGTGIASPTLAQMERLDEDENLLGALLTPTAPVNIAGLPAVTMPAGFTDRGTPLGVQLVGAEFSELLVLQAGHAFQRITDFHRRHPDLP